MKFILLPTLLAGFVLVNGCNSSKKAASSSATTTSKKGNISHEMLDERTFKLTAVSEDTTYGYTQKNAIAVGGGITSGARNEQLFMNALNGPNGEKISYNRRGSCCMFKTPNGLMGDSGLLDIYEVTWDGLAKPIVLYINMYDPGELKAPKGFTFKQ